MQIRRLPCFQISTRRIQQFCLCLLGVIVNEGWHFPSAWSLRGIFASAPEFAALLRGAENRYHRTS